MVLGLSLLSADYRKPTCGTHKLCFNGRRLLQSSFGFLNSKRFILGDKWFASKLAVKEELIVPDYKEEL